MSEKKSAKTPKKTEEGEQTVQVSNVHVVNVYKRKLAEADEQNTFLQALVMQQQEEINTLRATVDALAEEPKNREQRRAKEKSNGKRSK